MATLFLLLLLSLSLFFFVSASAHFHDVVNVTNNPADQLVEVVNKNRTANKGSSLYDNPGLACIALHYIKAYQGDCGAVGGTDAKKPAESEFAETFAPACGVLASTLTPLTGRLIGCQTKYVDPDQAFSDILIEDSKSLAIIHDKNHTELGAGVMGTDGGSPYFWCVLFSNGTRNSSYVLEGGEAKITRPGCFSGANDACSGASDWSQHLSLWSYTIAAALLALTCTFGL